MDAHIKHEPRIVLEMTTDEAEKVLAGITIGWETADEGSDYEAVLDDARKAIRGQLEQL